MKILEVVLRAVIIYGNLRVTSALSVPSPASQPRPLKARIDDLSQFQLVEMLKLQRQSTEGVEPVLRMRLNRAISGEGEVSISSLGVRSEATSGRARGGRTSDKIVTHGVGDEC